MTEARPFVDWGGPGPVGVAPITGGPAPAPRRYGRACGLARPPRRLYREAVRLEDPPCPVCSSPCRCPIRSNARSSRSPAASATCAGSTPEQQHLTLRFIGELDNGRLEEVAEALALVEGWPFELGLEGLGHFPPRGEPQVLWVGVTKSPELARLKRRIDRVLATVGLPPESRKFAPHVTLARVRGAALARAARHLSDAPQPVPERALRGQRLSPLFEPAQAGRRPASARGELRAGARASMTSRAELDRLLAEVAACAVCAPHLPLGPRPILQIGAGARLLIAGQAPGRIVHRARHPVRRPRRAMRSAPGSASTARPSTIPSGSRSCRSASATPGAAGAAICRRGPNARRSGRPACAPRCRRCA